MKNGAKKLLVDLFQAYFDARKNKRSTANALAFETDYESKLFQLHDDIVNRRYEPGRSVCFIVNRPVKREIFAADFRDRVVHHLLYNYLSPIFERRFLSDSYACRVGKGTHYGIKRLNHFIRSCSENYHQDCYILKLDIKGYFMSIDRNILFRKVERVLHSQAFRFSKAQLFPCNDKSLQFLKAELLFFPQKPSFHSFRELSSRGGALNPVRSKTLITSAVPKTERTSNGVKASFDFDLIFYLLRKIIFNDPTKNCAVKSGRNDWAGLPKSKSLFYAGKSKGLPIGNLTSQFFGNVYLNDFDHFVKHKLGCKYYGRYVDDFVIVHRDKEYLKSIISEIRRYLSENLGLELHSKKIYLQHHCHGVDFLGAIIKPYRIYVRNRIKGNFYGKIRWWNDQLAKARLSSNFPKVELWEKKNQAFVSSINSYLGTMVHWQTYRLRRKMLETVLFSAFLDFFGWDKTYRKVFKIGAHRV
ncbi:MAG: Retron-type reverse transcriptase [Candidatus Moranbacteria bacterium CG_4_9_14_3_um_filter_42_9]|nr:MAG: Retron-type reverse transcriptase [Candidatus Moranbacteria bacterium CG_4_9_14_3_um_filter_42_9]